MAKVDYTPDVFNSSAVPIWHMVLSTTKQINTKTRDDVIVARNWALDILIELVQIHHG